MRQTKKLRQLMTYVRARPWAALKGRFTGAASHDEIYWRAAQAGLAYDADAGWYVAETPTATPGSPFSVRLEGSHASLVAAETLLRDAGTIITTRSGPNPGRGGVWLTYLDCQLPRRRRSA